MKPRAPPDPGRPGIGLGLFFVAARALTGMVQEDDLRQGRIYPSLNRIREVSAVIAEAVAGVAFERGLARAERPHDLGAAVRGEMFDPTYPIYA